MKLRSLLSVLLALSAAAMYGEETFTPVSFSSAGINYTTLSESTVKVTGTTLTNVVNIPEAVKYEDKTYSVTTIGASAFSNKSAIYDITLPSSIFMIADNAFYGCSVSNLKLNEGLTTIGSGAFRDTKYLTQITLPSTVTNIGSSAFSYSAICDIEIPEGVMDLNTSTFYGCSSLTSVKLPTSLKTIGNSAFSDCISLKNVVLSDGIVTIGSSAFSKCNNLKNITLPPLVSTIESYTFSECTHLEQLQLPANLLTIKMRAFQNCKNLSSLSLPLKTNGIDREAFAGCGLTDIFIPTSIMSIYKDDRSPEWNAFGGCNNIQNVHIRHTYPKPCGAWQFAGSNYEEDGVHRTLYVPVGTKDLYASYDTYKVFDEIVEETISLQMESQVRMIANTTMKLNPKGSPEIFPISSLNWKSSNPQAATVDAFGNITAKSKGTTVITASFVNYDSEMEARCVVEVIDEPSTSFVIRPVKLTAQGNGAIPVEMLNKEDIIAFQCDIYLPSEMTFAKDEYGDYNFSYGGRETRSHVLECRLQPDGAMRVVGYSTSNSAYKDNQGILFNIPVSTTASTGDYLLEIRNILVTNKAIKESPLLDIKEVIRIDKALRGDANNDGRLTISDAALASAFMLGEAPDNFNMANADVIADGAITLADISEIVNLVLGAPAEATSATPIQKAHGVEFPTREGDKMSVADIKIQAGEEAEVLVSFDNIDPFTSFFAEIVLPEGLDFIDEDGEYFIDLDTKRKHRSHTSACKLQPDGRLRVMAYSSTNALFKGNTGGLFTFYVKASENFDSTKPTKILLENNYICNRNEEGTYTDYDVNNCESNVNLTVAVDEVAGKNWKIYSESGSKLVIVAPEEDDIDIVAIDGISRQIHICDGINRIDMTPGFYIVRGHKVIVR